ncbi:hypothetical protein [Curtobacterium sp. CFBP9011]|uniref:hypothetical protein n=1 Tax=Curtobacterium sp. CFBP9011 TaxID=3096530 RepID=UPI002A6AF60E|nr:hypothetical protein [Curtobacterium sp. CFBP9011]MDY1003896.1 hypothetical protein [Curtobacterium sp. CFBP9011]
MSGRRAAGARTHTHTHTHTHTQGGAARRVLGAHRAPLVAIAVVALLTALLGGSVLPALGVLATAGTQADLRAASVGARDLQATFAVSDDAASPAAAQRSADRLRGDLTAVRRTMPSALRTVTGPAGAAVTTRYLGLTDEPSRRMAAVTLAADDGVFDRVRFTTGRAPRPSADPLAIEVAVSTRVQTTLGWPVGHVRTISADGTALRLVGVYRPLDRGDPRWVHVPTTLRVANATGEDGNPIALATAFTAPGSAGAVASGRVTRGHVWFPLRPAEVDAADRADLVDSTRRFLTTQHALPGTAAGSTGFTTDLPALLGSAAARDATVGDLAAALASGPAGALLVLAGLLTRVLLDRAAGTLRLLGARGAPVRSVRTALAALVAVAAVPGAVVGGVLAVVVQAGPLGGRAPLPGLAAVAALVAAAVPCACAAFLAPVQRTGVPRRPLRPVVEGAVVLLTAAAVVTTVRRGTASSLPGGAVDPLAAALPLLLAATGVVASLRVLPLVLARVVALGRRQRGAAVLVGGVTAARTATVQAVPLVVAVIGIAVALFATVVSSTLVDGVAQAAHRSVAADVAVSSVALDPDQVGRIAHLPGVAAAVGVSSTDDVTFDTPHGSVQAEVLVADSATLARVQRGVPGALPTPSALRRTGTDRVPLVASRSLAAATGRDSSVLGAETRIVATAADAVPFTAARRWVLVDARTASAITDTGSVDRVLVRTAPGAHPVRVAAEVRALVHPGDVVTAVEAQRTLEADPRVPGTRVIATTAAVLAGVLGVGTLAVAALLAGAARRARGRLLGLLGADRRQMRAVVVAEAVPLLVASLVTGAAAALAIAATALPSADLRSFTGGVERPETVLDPVLLGAVGGGLLVALVGVLALTVRVGTPRDTVDHHHPTRRNR